MRRAQNTVKRGTFWRPGVSAAGAAAPLSYGEERTAVRQGHGQGAPGRILRADAPRRLRRISRPSISSQCGLESFWMGTCFRNIVLMLFEKSSSNRNFVGNKIDGFFGEQVSSRKLLPRVFPEELLPISTCYFV